MKAGAKWIKVRKVFVGVLDLKQMYRTNYIVVIYYCTKNCHVIFNKVNIFGFQNLIITIDLISRYFD